MSNRDSGNGTLLIREAGLIDVLLHFNLLKGFEVPPHGHSTPIFKKGDTCCESQCLKEGNTLNQNLEIF